MKQLNKIFKRNPLKFTFILSAVLHLTGFYCLYSLSYNLPVKTAEVVPIKIKSVIIEENKLKTVIKPEEVSPSGAVKKILDIKVPQLEVQQSPSVSFKKHLAISAHPVNSKESTFETLRPKTLYTEPSQTISKANNLSVRVRNTPASNTINFIENTTPASLHTRTINLKGSSSIILRKKEPVYTAKYQDNYVENPMAFSNSRISNEFGNKPKPFHSRSISESHASASLTHFPARLITQKVSKPYFYIRPKIRMASFGNGFSEEYLDTNKIQSNLNSDSTKEEQESILKLGRLRKGFVNHVRSNITKAKYYPRIARKLGFEGKPIVAFALGHKGELINLLLAQPSDYKVLNDAALETIRRGAPYPPIPDQLKEKLINFKLPISYVLGEY